MKIPMRVKYVDEAVGVYILCGRVGSETIDVVSAGAITGDVELFTLPAFHAKAVVAAQAQFRTTLYKILCEAKV